MRNRTAAALTAALWSSACAPGALPGSLAPPAPTPAAVICTRLGPATDRLEAEALRIDDAGLYAATAGVQLAEAGCPR